MTVTAFTIYSDIREDFINSFGEDFLERDIIEWVSELYDNQHFEKNYKTSDVIDFAEINFSWMTDMMRTDSVYNFVS